jgi:hypothetical protein
MKISTNKNMNSLQNLELMLAVSLDKYGPDKTVSMLHTMLLGELYDGNPVDNGFLKMLTQMLNKQNNRLLC